ncbi:MAG: SGNH/GDSL hydrolase family protein [Spirosomataceae bacterium]
MKKIGFIILGIFLIWGCKGNVSPSVSSNETTQIGLSYLALGDSYTIGESVPEQERWPLQLAAKLTSNGINVQNPRIIARTGWTTDELQSAIQSATLSSKYDLVSLLIGVNNQYRGRSSEVYRNEFINLLNKAVELAGNQSKNVFVVSIPDWGVTPFAAGRDRAKIAQEIDLFNQINREETLKRGILYFDITSISRENNPSYIAPDGLHPSGNMYKAWVDTVIFPSLFSHLRP